MNMITRTVARRPGTYMQPGADGVHINRVTLLAEPWAVPEVEAVHPRPAPGKFEAVSVRTPTIAKVRVPFVDSYAENDQDVLREHWLAGIPPKLRKGYREPRGYEPSRPVDREILAAIVKHLKAATDTRGGVMGALHLSEKTVDRAFRELREMGVLTKRYDTAVKLCFYRVTE